MVGVGGGPSSGLPPLFIKSVVGQHGGLTTSSLGKNNLLLKYLSFIMFQRLNIDKNIYKYKTEEKIVHKNAEILR